MEPITLMSQFKPYFKYDQLPDRLKDISKPFGEMAIELWTRHYETHASEQQAKVALQKLLESKDAAVRAVL